MLGKKKWGHWGWRGASALAVVMFAVGQNAQAHPDPIAGPQLCSSVHPHLAADDNPACGGQDLMCSPGFECTPNSDDIVDGDVWDVFGDGSCVFEFTVRDASAEGYAPGGPILDFVATGCSVEKWVSKGGPNGANLYNFLAPLTSEDCLHSPLGPNDKLSGLSHVTACVKRKISIRGKKEEAQGNVCPSGLGDCNTILGPLPNWTIELYHDADGEGDPDAGELLDSTTTNAAGEYKFEDLAKGLSYIVCEVIPPTPAENFFWQPCFPADGNAVGSDRFCYDPFTANSNVTGKNFRNLKETVCTDITGTKFCDEDGDGVFDPAETGAGMDGFCIILTESAAEGGTVHTDLTDGAGEYFFPGITSGQTVAISEDLDGSSCGSADKSGDWIETTPSSQNLVIPAGAGTAAGPAVGNKSIPTIDCGTDGVNIPNDTGLCTADFCFTPTATNLCGDYIIECTATNGVELSPGATEGELCGTFPAGCPECTTVTCVVTTDAGETDECSFDVCVTDEEDPTITCAGDETHECPASPSFSDPTCADNCPGSDFRITSTTPGGDNCVSTNTRCWVCDDECGNTSTECCQTLTVEDTTDPTINCPGDRTIDCDAEEDIPVTASDSCQGPLVPTCALVSDTIGGQTVWSQLAGGGIRVRLPFTGSATFECNVSDGCGNDADPCRFTVTADCLECRMTGGGNDGNIPPKSWGEGDDEFNQWTMGGQAGAPGAFDPAYGEWTHHQKNGTYGKFVFHAGTNSAPDGTLVEVITCHDPLSCHQARPAPAKQLDFSGVGSIKNGKLEGTNGVTYTKNDLLCFEVQIEDSGEPGNKSLTDEDNPGLCPQNGHPSPAMDGCDKCACADWYSITLWDCGTGAEAYHVDGYLHGGNFQIHPLVGTSYHGPTCE